MLRQQVRLQPPHRRRPRAPTAAVPQGAAGAGGPEGALPVYGNTAGSSKVFNPDMAVIGNFTGAAGKNQIDTRAPLEMGGIGSELPGHRRSVRARGLLLLVRARGRRSRGRIHHVHIAARRAAGESREVPRADRQGEHDARPRAAMGRRAARAEKPARSRGRYFGLRAFQSRSSYSTRGSSSRPPVRCTRATPGCFSRTSGAT